MEQLRYLRPGLIVNQDWGRQFSEEKLAAATAKTQLKRLPTVEV